MAVASSRQLTLSTVLLIGVVFLLATAFVAWSWHRRKNLSLRRREAELALQASEGRLRQISSQLPVALFEYVAAPRPRFRSISDGIARLLPFTAAEIMADPQIFFDAIETADVDGLTWRHGGRGATSPGRDFEWVGRSIVAGSSRWLQIRATTELTPEGEPSIQGVILDVTALKNMQFALERSHEELRRLASHREAGIEKERARLAREVHDELGQVLTAARMQLQLLRNDLGNPDSIAATARIEATESLIGEAYRSVKSIAADLRPGALNLGLTAAVEWLAERLLTPAGIRYVIEFDAAADTLTEEQSIGLFRVVQESLGNVVRHAGAREVRLEFHATRRLLIQDDGRGFDPASVDRSEHFGLLGMGERIEALGGTLSIHSQPGQGTTSGTTLTVELPA